MRYTPAFLALFSLCHLAAGCDPGLAIDVIVSVSGPGGGARPDGGRPDAGPAPGDGGPVIPAGCHCTRRPDSPSYQPLKCPPGADHGATAVIGPAGGVIAFDGTQRSGVSVQLEIPPGALAEATTITITELSTPPPTSIVDYSPLYRFDPPGLRLAKPARLRLPWGNLDGPVIPHLTTLWSTDGGQSFSSLPDNYVNAGFNQATITEFGLGITGAVAVNEPAHCR